MFEHIARINVEIAGIVPLLMANDQAADPLNSWSKLMKQVSGKGKKTEDDHMRLAELEWNSLIYHDDEIGPYIPDRMLRATMRRGAIKFKRGLGDLLRSGVDIDEMNVPLLYGGPRDRTPLFADSRFVDRRTVKLKKTTTVVRTRPRFNEWALAFTLVIDTSSIGVQDVENSLRQAGQYCGIGDYRPDFGRFKIRKYEPMKK